MGCAAAATVSVSKRTLSVTECLGDAPVSHMLSKRSGISIAHNNRGKHNDNNHEDIKKSQGTQEQKELGKSHELSATSLWTAGMRREG